MIFFCVYVVMFGRCLDAGRCCCRQTWDRCFDVIGMVPTIPCSIREKDFAWTVANDRLSPYQSIFAACQAMAGRHGLYFDRKETSKNLGHVLRKRRDRRMFSDRSANEVHRCSRRMNIWCAQAMPTAMMLMRSDRYYHDIKVARSEAKLYTPLSGSFIKLRKRRKLRARTPCRLIWVNLDR